MSERLSVATEYCRKFPGSGSRTLAHVICKERPGLFDTLEQARSKIRYVRGSNGILSRQNLSPRLSGIAEDWNNRGLLAPETINTAPFILKGERNLILSDTQFPFHEPSALDTALDFGKKMKADSVVLNGDIFDCYQLSKFTRLPNVALFRKERAVGREFFATVRSRFPKARIVFKAGNHEERLQGYLARRAPEIFGEEFLDWDNILGLKELGIEYVDPWRMIKAGKINIFHGSEFGSGVSIPVNPARWLFLRTKSVAMCGHFHATSQHNEPNVDGVLLSCWSTGALCQLNPRWKPYNTWNHGFAYLRLLDSEGNFDLHNFRILKGGRLVT